MKNNNYNLQILHHSEVFETRDAAMTYLNDFYKPNSLDAEPVIVKYGDNKNPDVILAFGTSDTAPGSFYTIDMTKANEQIDKIQETIDSSANDLTEISKALENIVVSTGLINDENKKTNKITYNPDAKDDVIGSAVSIAEAVDLLSKYVQKELNGSELTVEDTNSVKLIYEVNSNGGKTLKANVAISSNGNSNDLNFDNNIIGIKDDGLYAASNLSYDEARHQLVFTTSGYKNGRYQDDAIVQKVDLGEHTKLVADNDGHNVKLIITEDSSNYTANLSADVQIANRENNILKTSDGKLFVEGIAKNIKFGDSTVAAALTKQRNDIASVDSKADAASKSADIQGGKTDTLETKIETLSDGGAKVTGDVRLGSKNSIIVKNGGLEANIKLDVNTATNTLILSVGDEQIVKALPGIDLIDNITYDAANKNVIIVYNENEKTTIPLKDLIAEFNFKNDNEHDVELITSSNVDGSTDVFARTKVSDSIDNLITHDNGGLFVSESKIDAKVTTEQNRAENAEKQIATSIEELKSTVEANVDSIKSESNDKISDVNSKIAENSENISTLRTDLTSEIGNRTNADTELTGKIDKLTDTLNTTQSDLSSKISKLETDTNTRISHDVSDLNDKITAISQAVTDGDTNTLTQSKEYVNTSVTNEKTEREAADEKIKTDFESKITKLSNTISTLETSSDTSIKDALASASQDATDKANTAEANAKSYTDSQVETEAARAKEAETNNSNAISDLTEKVDKKIEKVDLEKHSDLEYFLNVDGVKVGTINIPEDQFFKGAEYDSQAKALTLNFRITENGVTSDQSVKLDISDLVDTYTAGNGLTVENNQFSVAIDENSEKYLVISNNKLSLSGVDDAIKANLKDTIENLDSSAESSTEHISIQIVENDGKLSAVTLNEADIASASELETVKENISANSKDIETFKGNEATDGSILNAIKLSKEYTDEQISNIEASRTNSVNGLQEKIATNSESIVTETNRAKEKEAELESNINDIKFITKETDTVRITTDKQTGDDHRTLSADVKLKTITDGTNIIKSDGNGLFASVTLAYNKATNVLTFNDGNATQNFELSNYGILQDAYYDSENKQIVLDVKKDDSSISQLKIGVSDLVNTWTVAENTTSPIVLIKTSTTDNGDVLSAELRILENDKNLLKNNNGSLFVDGDSNSHYALWGGEETNVQAALNKAKEGIDKIDNLENQVKSITELINTLSSTVTTLETKVTELESKMSKVGELEEKLNNLQTEVDGLKKYSITDDTDDNPTTD